MDNIENKINNGGERKQSKQKGVHWSKNNNKWEATIKIKNKNYYLGCYLKEEDAINARIQIETKYKETGKINLPRTQRTKNDITIKDSYAIIALYNNDNIKIADTYIDIEDIPLINKYKWYLGNDGYVRSGNKPLYLHRIIMKCDNDINIDHIDRNPLNNRKYNIRVATDSQNMMNRGIQKNNTSGITGVCWIKEKCKWKAQIKINRKNINLGYFSNFDDAVKARKGAEKKYFKEFAVKEKTTYEF